MSITANEMPSGSYDVARLDDGDVDVSPPSDEQLLMAYRDFGQRGAFERLVHRYEHELYSYLRRYLGDTQMAEDVFQATFLQIHLKCRQFEEGRQFRPWLYTIATHQAIDFQRKNRRHRIVSLDRSGSGDGDLGSLIDLLASGEPGPVSRIEARERRDWIRSALGELSQTLRATVVLVYYQGLKYSDAADILGVPVGTVKSRLNAAILKLNQAWAGSNPAASSSANPHESK